jgi:hypothetical protein
MGGLTALRERTTVVDRTDALGSPLFDLSPIPGDGLGTGRPRFVAKRQLANVRMSGLRAGVPLDHLLPTVIME